MEVSDFSFFLCIIDIHVAPVYDGSVELEEGETPESRFIKIQAAYELLIDREQRRQYDYDNRTNPLKVSLIDFVLSYICNYVSDEDSFVVWNFALQH